MFMKRVILLFVLSFVISLTSKSQEIDKPKENNRGKGYPMSLRQPIDSGRDRDGGHVDSQERQFRVRLEIRKGEGADKEN